MVSGTSFQIEEVFRGVHNIQAEVLDESGELMIRSRPNRFYVQQNTVAVLDDDPPPIREAGAASAATPNEFSTA